MDRYGTGLRAHMKRNIFKKKMANFTFARRNWFRPLKLADPAEFRPMKNKKDYGKHRKTIQRKPTDTLV